MPFYNIKKILTPETSQDQKWYTDVICDLKPTDGFIIIFDINTNSWILKKNYNNITVFNKSNPLKNRILREGDFPDETETDIEPFNIGDNIFPYQYFLQDNWVIDINGLLDHKNNQLNQEHENHITNYRGKVSILIETESVIFDSGEKYLKNCNFAIAEISKGTIQPVQIWLDYSNQPRELNISQLQILASTIETDLFISGQMAYLKKWEFRAKLNSETDYKKIYNMEFEF
jgi:hypothetical protein